jgi:hypothetical protein
VTDRAVGASALLRARGLACALGLSALVSLLACRKDDPPGAGSVPVPAPPAPASQAAREQLITSIGSGRALDREVVPETTEWRGWLAVDDRVAAAFGEVDGAPLALVTTDGGTTWRTVRGERSAASAWALSDTGMVALLTASEDGPAGRARSLGSLRVSLMGAGDTSPGPPSLVLPAEGAKKPRLGPDTLLASFVGPDALAVLAVDAAGPARVHVLGPASAPPSPPLPLPATEKLLPGVYGHPAQLASLRGRQLVIRPAPAQGQALTEPVVVEGFAPPPTLLRDVSGAPVCRTGKWTHRLVAPGGARDFVLSISPDKAGAIPIATPRPARVGQATMADGPRAFGCGGDSVSVEIRAGGEGRPLTCALGAACVAPDEPPFRPWATAHQRRMHVVPTARGVIAAVTRSEGSRWGAWLAQSVDAGKTWQLPRVIAEGDVERGRVEVGMLAALGGRALLLLRGDVSGTTQRAWFVLVSDDGGSTWAAP